MSPALIALIIPLLTGLVHLIAGPGESWIIDHVITYAAGVIARQVQLDPSWSLNAAISDAASGTVTLTIARSGRTAFVVVIEPLGLTAAHQTTIAAIFGALFHEGETRLLALFATANKSIAASQTLTAHPGAV